MTRVVFIGAGPGAADLITVRGAQRLAEADVVLFDALTDPALRALAPRARWLDVGKRGFAHATGQARINELLVRHAQGDTRVVRLKGGDPSVFGRLEEELQALAAHGIEAEVVPGVTAALAAAADARRPLTRRGKGRSVTLSTAMTAAPEGAGEPDRAAARPLVTYPSADPRAHPCADPNADRGADSTADRATPRPLHASSGRADTEVFYMAGKQLGRLGRRLLEAGWAADTPVLVVSRAGWPDAIVSDHRAGLLAEAALLHAGRPAVVTVGAGATRLATREQGSGGPRQAAGTRPVESAAGPVRLMTRGAA